ncbi:MAG: RNA 2',3'-cyclic phosphodiesterase [Rhodobacterales bacterium]|nr:RNA 2',3'-cyclic phosphodiesterase [Rhodobacterales bacterium]MDX5498567.1 RNA 2',3'-cyclic phosphodiesterase [Rhodobacterales bacterium]
MTRAFVALPLPEHIRSKLAVAQFLLPLQRKVPAENLHITLVFLDEVPDPVLADVHLALSALGLPPVTLRLHGFGLFGGARPRSLHAQVEAGPELGQMQARIARACTMAGAPAEQRRFVPHVTLGRFRADPAEAMRLERAVAEGAGFSAGPWVADRLVLYRSDRGHDGAHHSELAAYPLTG